MTKVKTSKGSLVLLMAAILFGLSACGGGAGTDSSESSGVGGTGITNIFSSPSEMGVGDIMPIEFGEDTQVAVDFSGVTDGVEFILAVGSYNYSGTGTQMSLSSASESVLGNFSKATFADYEDPFEGKEYGPQEVLSAWLRASESVLVDTESPVESFSMSKSMSVKAASVGATESFKVLASLTSTQTTVDVSATAKCIGQNVVFYLDNEVPSSTLSDADISDLCASFDAIAGEEFALLGSLRDPDGDKKVHVLMTKQVNELGALGGGIITGYFYAGDYYSGAASNNRDVIYTMVPDPTGAWGVSISKSFAMTNLLPAVLPHELQHAISYNQHVFVNGGSAEENWLNEGLSHFMEDYFGYGVENPSRYAMFLASPSTYGVVTTASPNLMERGAAYLFMRFLYEQAANGEDFLKGLYGSKRGVENLEAAFSGPEDMNQFSEFMARWTIALAMTDRGISTDPRYVYRPRVVDEDTGNFSGACLNCDANDNRGTELDGVNLNSYFGVHSARLDASAMTFYAMSTFPDNMTLTGTANGGNYGILIRTK